LKPRKLCLRKHHKSSLASWYYLRSARWAVRCLQYRSLCHGVCHRQPVPTTLCFVFRWLSGDAMTRSDLQSGTAGALSLYDLGGPFLILAAVVSALLAASVAVRCIRRRRRSLGRLPGAKLVTLHSIITDVDCLSTIDCS